MIELEALAKQPHGAETDKVFTLMSRSDAKFLATMISTYNEDYEVSVSYYGLMTGFFIPTVRK